MPPRIDTTSTSRPNTVTHEPAPKRVADVEKPTAKPASSAPKGVDQVADKFERTDATSAKRGADVIGKAAAVDTKDEHAQHVAQVRKDLDGQKLPTSAKGVAVIVVGEDAGSAHGEAIARTIAGPAGLAQGASVHLRSSGKFQSKYVDASATMKEISSAKGALTTDQLSKIGAVMAEGSLYAAQKELAAVNTELPGDGKTRIASMSWGFSVSRIAAEQAVALPKNAQIFRDKAAEIEKANPRVKVDVDNPKHMKLLRSLVANDIAAGIEKELAKPDNKKRFDALKSGLESELTTAKAKGLLVFNAAGNERDIAQTLGNEARSTNFFDGVKGLLTVGAADLKKSADGTDDEMWKGSAVGKVKVAAPGVNLPVGAKNAPETGTSFATPYMASVAALMVAAYPGIKPDQIVAILDSGKVTKDLPGTTDGLGLIDPVKAVAEAKKLADAASAKQK